MNNKPESLLGVNVHNEKEWKYFIVAVSTIEAEFQCEVHSRFKRCIGCKNMTKYKWYKVKCFLYP